MIALSCQCLRLATTFTATGGTGTALTAGDYITTDQTVYVYTETGTIPNCFEEEFFTIDINTTPTPDSLANVVICDSFELPVVTVGNYFTATGGTGTALTAGDYITTDQTVYVYAETGTTPNCFEEEFFTVDINTSPVITADSTNPTVCGAKDGSIRIEGLINGTSYDWTYTTPSAVVVTGTSVADASGQIEVGDTLVGGTYTAISVTINGCTSNIITETLTDPGAPAVDNPGPLASCDKCQLPAITGTNLTGNEAYYSAANGQGDQYAENDYITTSGTYYVLDSTVACKSEVPFTITINTTPIPDSLANVVICDSFELPVLTVGNYFTATGGAGTALTAGDYITTDQTVYVYAETGTTPNCFDEEFFTVDINTTNPRFTSKRGHL